MTPTDPELVTRQLREQGEALRRDGFCVPADLLFKAAAALDAARQREGDLERCSEHPEAPLELVCVECFESDLTAAANERAKTAEARVQQLEAALKELAHRWRAESEAIESEDDDASLKRFGTQMDPDGYILATVTLDTCAEELEKTVAVGRADTRRVEVSPVTWTVAPPCQVPAPDGRRCMRPVGHDGTHDWQADTPEPPRDA